MNGNRATNPPTIPANSPPISRRARCLTCRALVSVDGLDLAGQCDSCAVQRGLFPVKPWRRRKAVGGGYDPRTGRWGGRRG
jgi:hypothetical protein